MTDLPLAGIRVLDLTRLLPGPLATQQLADLGAEVIKIDDTGRGDDAQRLGAAPDDGGPAWLYRICNRGKRSICLDLKHSDGRAAFLRLAETAHIVVEGFRPGVVARLGVDFEAVRAVRPDVVYCAISGYGQTGPWASYAGHDLNYQAMSGVLAASGPAGGPPGIPAFQIGDLLGGTQTAVSAMLAAVLGAQRTGQGRYLDVAMTDGVRSQAVFPRIAALAGERHAPGDDLLTGGMPCYAVYACADGRYLAVAALEPKFWSILCEVIGRPDLLPRHYDPTARAELAAVLARDTRDAWAARFEPADCCVTPVLEPAEALIHPQAAARGDGLGPPPYPVPGLAAHHADWTAPGADTLAVLDEIGLDAAGLCLRGAARQAGAEA